MEKYTGLKYISNEGMIKKGCPKVYFCCHPEDFRGCFPGLAREILDIQENAVVWYSDPEEIDNSVEALLEDIEMMQLLVVPITSNFLYKESRARSIEFAYALERNISILPILMEDNLENDFNRICGSFHCLNRYSKDDTALSYEEKLGKFITSVLTEENLLEKIRDAFDAYIFLSYRKKDRKHANAIMKLIHKNEFCRDIAIWYDEYLVPGENFNEAIIHAMNKSSLFALVVTPNILEDDNYVMRVEYPSAINAGMDIIPIEAVETTNKELEECYPLIGSKVSVDNEDEICNRIEKIIKKAVLDEKKSTPEHLFFIGLAYLKGIDVEVNCDRAISLIAKAAEADLPEAIEKLVSIYRYGDGIKPNLMLAVKYQKKYLEILERKNDGFLTYEKRQLADMLIELGRFSEAEDILMSIVNKTKNRLVAEENFGTCYDYVWSLIPFAELCERMEEDDRALKIYEECIQILNPFLEPDSENKPIMECGLCERKRGYIFFKQEKYEEAFDSLYRSLSLYRILYEKDKALEIKFQLLELLSKCGDIKAICGQTTEAEKYFEEALKVNKEFVFEDGNRRFYANYIMLLIQYLNIKRKQGNFLAAIHHYEEDEDIINEAVQKAVRKQELKLLIMMYFIFENAFSQQNDSEMVSKMRTENLSVIKTYLAYYGYDDEMVVAAFNEYGK